MRRHITILVALVACLVAGTREVRAQQITHGMPGRDGGFFVENRGQIVDTRGERRPDILYTAEAGGATIYLRREGFSYVFVDRQPARMNAASGAGGIPRASLPRDTSTRPASVTGRRVDVELVGANPHPAITSDEPGRTYSNYYLGHIPDGITEVPGFDRITYHDIYPSIDLVLRSDAAGMKYDFVVRPGGRIADIRLKYRGAAGVAIAGDGSMRVDAAPGRIEEQRPFCYQIMEHGRRERRTSVPGRYILDGTTLSFAVGGYDRRRTLVIDPVIRWSTYVAGSRSNRDASPLADVSSVGADAQGNVYIAGLVTGMNFPVTAGAFQMNPEGWTDCFAARLDTSGRLVWATYYGGSEEEWGSIFFPASSGMRVGATVDRSGTVAICGSTQSTDLPVSPGAFQPAPTWNPDPSLGWHDAFVVTFDRDGRRRWATYYGGSQFENAASVALDPRGNVIITGSTESPDRCATPGAFQSSNAGGLDLFIAKFAPDGRRLWGTFYGGSRVEYEASVTTDSSGNILLTGTTGSADFPVSPAAFQPLIGGTNTFEDRDAFLVKLDGNGDRLWATYLGGGTGDYGTGIATDSAGNVAVVGMSDGKFPISVDAIDYGRYASPGTADLFIARFNARGRPSWVTVYGGSGIDDAYGVAFTDRGEIMVTGYTASENFPVTPGSLKPPGRDQDAFILSFDSTGLRRWASRLGGADFDAGHAVAVVNPGTVLVAGMTQSTDFPTTPGVFQESDSVPGSSVGFVIKLCDTTGLSVPLRTIDVCPEEDTTLTAHIPAPIYRWSTGAATRSITATEPGLYTVRLIFPGTCVEVVDSFRVIAPSAPAIVASGPLRFCAGDTLTLDAGTGYTRYRWSTGETSRKIIATRSGRYGVSVTTARGCVLPAEPAVVQVDPRPPGTIAGPASVCANGPGSYSVPPIPGVSWQWSVTGGGGLITGDPTKPAITVRWGPSGSGIVRLHAAFDSSGCAVDAEMTVSVGVGLRPVVAASPSATLCEGGWVTLDAGLYATYRWSTGEITRTIRVTTPGSFTVDVTDIDGCSGTSAPVVVTVNPAPKPAVTASRGVSLCEGDSTVLDASDGWASYLWSDGRTSRSIAVRTAGTYSVTVTDAIGCGGVSEPVTVSVTSPVIAVMPAGPVELCRGESVMLRAQDGFAAYEWSNGASGQAITVTEPGSYSVKGTDAGGCSGTSQPVAVTMKPAVVVEVTPAGPVTLCQGDSITLSAPEGFTGYAWSNGASARSITVGSAGMYTATVTDAGGCSGTSGPVEVAVTPAPGTPTIMADGDTLRSSLAASYRWSLDGAPIAGAVSRNHIATRPGSYTVTVSEGGCSSTSDPFAIVSQPVVWLDTASASVGERFRLRMHLRPPLRAIDGVTGYTATLRIDPGALFPHRAFDLTAASGGSTGLIYRVDGTMTIEHTGTSPAITGDLLFELEMEGLASGKPLDPVEIQSVQLIGMGNIPVAGNGLVILSGCDIARDFAFGRRVTIVSVRPLPASGEITLTYRAPEGSAPLVTLTDVSGRTVLSRSLAEGTGGEQTASIRIDGITSGLYRLELRDGPEVSAAPIVVVK